MVRGFAMAVVLLGAIQLPARAATGAPTGPNVFRSEMARVEIQKPADWHFAKADSSLTNLPSVRLGDEEFLEVVKRMNKRPLMAATKHEDSYSGLNPSLQLIVRPAANMEGKSGLELLQLYIPRLKQAFTGFKVVKEPYAITVAGRSGGRLDVAYTITSKDEKTMPGASTLILVPNGKVVYQVGFSYPPEGPDKLTKEIDQVLGSVKWLD